MAEGRFWKCKWTRERGIYRVWIARRQTIIGTGRRWEEALDRLCTRIVRETGDGEPRLSFDPPEPVFGGDARFAHPDWLKVGVEGYLSVEASDPALFTQGYCEHCGNPRGERTNVRLRAEGPGDADLCSPSLFGNRFVPVLGSERFRELLTAAERAAFRWLPVDPAPRTRKRFFECIPKRMVRTVAVRGFTIDGSICPVCRSRFMMCTSEPEVNFGDGQIHDWVSGEDLPRRPRGVVAVGDLSGWSLLFPAARARELAARVRGASTDRIGAAPPDCVIREPRLPRTRRFRQ